MGSGQDARSRIKRAFPGREGLIDRAFRDDPTFRELCRDYRECAIALEEWRRLHGDGPTSRSREYAELLDDLVAEIGNWLDTFRADSSRTDGSRPR
jgi:hypothetical protein